MFNDRSVCRVASLTLSLQPVPSPTAAWRLLPAWALQRQVLHQPLPCRCDRPDQQEHKVSVWRQEFCVLLLILVSFCVIMWSRWMWSICDEIVFIVCFVASLLLWFFFHFAFLFIIIISILHFSLVLFPSSIALRFLSSISCSLSFSPPPPPLSYVPSPLWSSSLFSSLCSPLLPSPLSLLSSSLPHRLSAKYGDVSLNQKGRGFAKKNIGRQLEEKLDQYLQQSRLTKGYVGPGRVVYI